MITLLKNIFYLLIFLNTYVYASRKTSFSCGQDPFTNFEEHINTLNISYDTNYQILLDIIDNKLLKTKLSEKDQRFHLRFLKSKILFDHEQYETFKTLSNDLLYDLSSSSCKHFRFIIQRYFWTLKGKDRYIDKISLLDFILKNKPDFEKRFLHNEMANIYFHLGFYDLAIMNFKHLLELSDNDPGFRASINNNIGLAFLELNDIKNAGVHFNKAIELWNNEAKTIKLKVAEDVYNNFKQNLKDNISELSLLYLDNDTLVYNTLKKRYYNLSGNNGYTDLTDNKILLNLAEYAFKSGHSKDVHLYLSKIEDNISNNYKIFIEDKPRHEFLLWQYEVLKGDSLKALHHSHIYKALRDSIDIRNKTLIRQVGPFDIEWKTQLLTERNNTLKIERKLKQVLSVVTIILIVTLILLLLSFLNQKKTKQQIANKNKEISLSLKNKDLLLQEIHHRVKNNLQLVSSIAYLEHKKNKHNFDYESFENRILSLSVIHRLLYTTENISEISFITYTQKLLLNISNSISEYFTYELECEDRRLKLETAINFGLLINELVTNTIKHCTPAEHTQIHIQVKFYKENNQYVFVYKDNGTTIHTGESSHFNFGNNLIKLLIRQLRGKHHIQTTSGYDLTIYFKTLI